MYLVLSTSLNPKSRSRVLAHEMYKRIEQCGASVVLHDLVQHNLPMCDAGACYAHPAAQELARLVNAAKGIIVAAPIYNYDVGASAKNAVELTGKAWTDKVVGFVCAAGGGVSYMAVMGLANSLMLDFHTFIIPRFVMATGKAFDETGRIHDETIHHRLNELADALLRVTSALHPPHHNTVPPPPKDKNL